LGETNDTLCVVIYVWLFIKEILKKFIKNFDLKIEINIKPIEKIELIEPIKVEPIEIKTEQIETTGDFLIFICLMKILNVLLYCILNILDQVTVLDQTDIKTKKKV
jgi:hypothetical protein